MVWYSTSDAGFDNKLQLLGMVLNVVAVMLELRLDNKLLMTIMALDNEKRLQM